MRIIIIIIAFLFAAGCSTMQGLGSDDIRAALNECKKNNLEVLAYKRLDGSIMAIRCIPTEQEIKETYKVRKRNNALNVVRLLW